MSLLPNDGRSRRAHLIAEVVRDWIHETPLSQCGAGADTCPDWPMAYELADLIESKLVAALGVRSDPEDPVMSPRLRYRIPQEGERVRMSDGPEQGRCGTVDHWDSDRSILFVDLDARPDPNFEPGYLLGTHPLEVESLESGVRSDTTSQGDDGGG